MISVKIVLAKFLGHTSMSSEFSTNSPESVQEPETLKSGGKQRELEKVALAGRADKRASGE